MNQYKLEKSIFTQDDFQAMGWHDCPIRSVAFSADTYEFLMDIDYIFQWVHPEGQDTHFSFWIAPATMVFENISDLHFDIKTDLEIDIAEISKSNPRPSPNGKFTMWDYQIECHEGIISLTATGFTMIVRQAPILQQSQIIDLADRGGISFDRETTIK